MKGFLLSGLLCLTACASLSPERDARDAASLRSWQERRENGEAAANLPEIETFLRERKSSKYVQAARLEKAQALFESGRSAEAENLFRSVRELSLGKQEALVARAEWGLSLIQEERGDELRALAHLMSAENLSRSLPPEIAKAELPARKAFLLHKLGRSAEAAESLKRAEAGLKELLSDPRVPYQAEWVTRLYYQMGSALSETISEENFEGFIQAQRSSQVYLLKALAAGHPVWSPKALEVLRRNFAGFWNFLLQMPLPSGQDPAVARREKRRLQIPRLSEFLGVLEMAQAYAPVRGDRANPWQKDFHAMVDDLREKARAVLYSSSETTVLTEESRLLNGLRRGGSPRARPEAKKSSPAPTQDPNL